VAGALVVGVDVPAERRRARPARRADRALAARRSTTVLRVLALRELVIKDDTAHCFNRRYLRGVPARGAWHAPAASLARLADLPR
jgi:hypothetical protein